jgi:archaellum component FlaC
MAPKRKRASSSKDNDADFAAADDVKVNSNKRFEQRMEELLNSISREVSDLRNENKNMKESINETIKEMKSEIKGQNDEIKHEIGDMKDTIDEMKDTIDEVKTKVDDNPSPLWKLVTEWRDVFEKEVLTKLNGTEQKLFSQTCRASREAIRRAKIKLRRKFWIHELSSISQLELAWANYQWGAKGKYIDDGEEYTKNQEEFCAQVAYTNDLALLRWVREEKECAWDYLTSGMAARLGNLEMLKYCVENGCKVHDGTCALAAKFGNLECLKYLREKNVKWSHRTVQLARENNHVECLNYALANNCPQTLEEWQALEAAAALQATEEEQA